MKNNLFNTVIILAGIVLIAIFSFTSCNRPTKQVKSHSVQTAPDEVESETESTSLDAEVDLALENFEKGMATGDMSLAMGGGIQKLLGVLKQDSNNIRALYHLGEFSIQSGQYEKAEKRFEKLVLLQPENQEYKDRLTEIRKQLGRE